MSEQTTASHDPGFDEKAKKLSRKRAKQRKLLLALWEADPDALVSHATALFELAEQHAKHVLAVRATRTNGAHSLYRDEATPQDEWDAQMKIARDLDGRPSTYHQAFCWLLAHSDSPAGRQLRAVGALRFLRTKF